MGRNSSSGNSVKNLFLSFTFTCLLTRFNCLDYYYS